MTQPMEERLQKFLGEGGGIEALREVQGSIGDILPQLMNGRTEYLFSELAEGHQRLGDIEKTFSALAAGNPAKNILYDNLFYTGIAHNLVHFLREVSTMLPTEDTAPNLTKESTNKAAAAIDTIQEKLLPALMELTGSPALSVDALNAYHEELKTQKAARSSNPETFVEKTLKSSPMNDKLGVGNLVGT